MLIENKAKLNFQMFPTEYSLLKKINFGSKNVQS